MRTWIVLLLIVFTACNIEVEPKVTGRIISGYGESSCLLGEHKCVGNYAYQCFDSNTDGLNEWITVDCFEEPECSGSSLILHNCENGACAEQIEECISKQYCDGNYLKKGGCSKGACVTESKYCRNGCANNECVVCRNECEKGEARCDSLKKNVQICTDSNRDGCGDWREPHIIDCPTGCQDGKCVTCNNMGWVCCDLCSAGHHSQFDIWCKDQNKQGQCCDECSIPKNEPVEPDERFIEESSKPVPTAPQEKGLFKEIFRMIKVLFGLA